MRIRKCVIPAAGFGMRLLPATKSQPKEMLPIGRKPVIQYVVEEAVEAGLKEILIVTGARKRSIEDHFDYDQILWDQLAKRGISAQSAGIKLFARQGIQLLFTRQSCPTGIADAVSLAEVFVDGKPFVVCLGDNIVVNRRSGHFLSSLMSIYESKNCAAVVALKKISPEDSIRYGVAKVEDSGELVRITGVVEKPPVEKAPSNLALAGRYVFDASILDAIKKTPIGVGGERQLTDAIGVLLSEGKEVYGLVLDEGNIVHDIGTPYSYALAFIDLCLRDPELGPKLKEDIRKMMRSSK